MKLKLVTTGLIKKLVTLEIGFELTERTFAATRTISLTNKISGGFS
jgi:hypothetical protein